MDRYGDVLNQTAPTVGDVRDAGTDLEEPRADALAKAESAVEAQQSLTDAKQELAVAQAALASVTSSQGTGSASSSTPAVTTSPKPLAPTATVNRVKQAESEFSTVQEGINDRTPLSQASQQFNAAAVAVEMSWLRLFADAGCLTDEQHLQAEAAVRDYTTALQQSLRDAGYYDGEVDGVYGPATVDAIEALQKTHGLPITGIVDKASAAALQGDLAAKGGAIAQEAVASTSAVQQTLKLAGFWDGPVDGQWTPELTVAVKDFQTELGVTPTGAVDAATVAALEKAIEGAAVSRLRRPVRHTLVLLEPADDEPIVRIAVRRGRPHRVDGLPRTYSSPAEPVAEALGNHGRRTWAIAVATSSVVPTRVPAWSGPDNAASPSC